MSLVKSYLRREIMLPFFYALLVLVFILLLGQLFKIVNMVVSEGVRIWDVMHLVLAMIPQMLTMALPLAFFFAVLAGVGRLVGDGEVTALQAAGISPYQMLTPILQLAIACTMLTMLMSAWLAPWGIRQVRKVTFAILQDKVTLALRPQSLNLTFPGMTIYLGDIDKKSGRLNSVFIEDHRKSEAPQTITALTGRLVSDKPTSTLSLELENGTIHEYNQLKESYRITDFSKYKVNFEISALLGEKSH
ncbi:MAG: LptF/LptG family permease, partial [Deltaproteobacteria bacterium]|nr:LptF/LptG family permease [Candidatus Tharpella sp.]